MMEALETVPKRNSTLSLRSNFSKGDCLKRSLFGLKRLKQKLSVIVLEGIDIKPNKPNPTVLNLRQSFLFPPNYNRTVNQQSSERFTQTSKTNVGSNEKEKDHIHVILGPSIVSSEEHLTSQESHNPRNKQRLMTPTLPYQHGAWYVRPESARYKGKKTAVTHKEKFRTTGLDCRSDEELNRLLIEDQEAMTMDVEERLDAVIEALLDHYWEANLHALRSLIDLCSVVNWKDHERYLATIYRRFIDLLKSPRSSIVRVTCQAAGELFKSAKCYKRPEFDEIVTLILGKTADPNRFIQKDANVALDKMVTFIPLMHSIRALSTMGPTHKNAVVRTATARLFVCACAMSGIEIVLGVEANPRTRKRILTSLTGFLVDKCCEVRKFAERLYKILKKHKFFNDYFFKDMECGMRFQYKKIFATLDEK